MIDCCDTQYTEMAITEEWYGDVICYIDNFLAKYPYDKDLKAISKEWKEFFKESEKTFYEKAVELINSKAFNMIIGEVIDIDEGNVEFLRKCYNNDNVYAKTFKMQWIIDKIYFNQEYASRDSEYYESWEDNDADELKSSRDSLYYLLNELIGDLANFEK